MSSELQIFVASIFGVLATLIASGMGLYFTSRARTSSLRHSLYDKQLDASVEAMKHVGEARTYAVMLSEPTSEYAVRARSDIGLLLPKLERSIDVAAAILPIEIFVELRKFGSAISNFLVEYDGGKIDEEFSEVLSGQGLKVGLMIRAVLGVDELSDESVNLFGSTDDIERLGKLTSEQLVTVAKSGQSN